MEIIAHALDWLASEHGLQAMLMRNWLLGLIIIALVIYTESVAFFLPFLPGDSLLVTAGVFMAAAGISPIAAIAIIGGAAVLADATNYWLGASKLGQRAVAGNWLKDKHVSRVERYFLRFGGITIVFARFMPLLRTAAPFLAGLTRLNLKKCSLYSVLGAFIWVGSLILLGGYAARIDWVKRYIILWPMILTAVGLVTFLIYAMRQKLKNPNSS